MLQRVDKVAYELKLPTELSSDHPVFHVSMLKKVIGDPKSIHPIEGLCVDENLSFEAISVESLDILVKKLRYKETTFVKVLWKNNLFEGATWEAVGFMRSCYPHFIANEV
ncbi:uncharacterized protein LOC114076883 [Solanum pennellii]|uniref:Uncharacterized protein LOC114076883 n=1 Tax=Solanum pennellii TaxID=28526 RepID=A0ABM1V9G5_SOLPN|nr:uncharacterized protein LOC114076883 [Solanum pennellii]